MSQYPVWHSCPAQQLAPASSDPMSSEQASGRTSFKYSVHDSCEVAAAQLAIASAVAKLALAVAFASHSLATPSRQPGSVPYCERRVGMLH
jgi:hypothetical protein